MTDNDLDLLGPFSVRSSGNVGQEILNSDGIVIAWTTDEWTSRVICKLLNEHEGLLGVASPSAPALP